MLSPLIGRKKRWPKDAGAENLYFWKIAVRMARAGFGVDAQADFIDFMGAENADESESGAEPLIVEVLGVSNAA